MSPTINRIRTLDVSIKRFDKRLEVAQNAGYAGGPEGVRAIGPNNPSLSAIQSHLCSASLQDRDNGTRIQQLTFDMRAESDPLTELLRTKLP